MDAYFNPGTATFRTFEASWVTNREARRPTSALFMTGVVGSTLLLLVLVIILVIRYQQPLVCGSVICDYYSDLLSESLDPSVDPCTDFHQFVCSGWEASNNKPLVVDVYKRFISKVSLHAWKMAVPSTGQSASQKGAMFYKSCYGVYGSKEDNLEAIKSSLLSAHVHWPDVNSNASLLRVLFSMTAEWNWASPIHFLLYRAGKLEVKPTGFYTATLDKRQAMLRNAEQGSYFAGYYQKLVQAFSRPDVEPLSYANLSALEAQVMSTLLVPLRLAKWRSMTNASLDDLMTLAKGAFPRNLWEEELPTLCNKTGECGNFEFTIWNVDFLSAFFSLVQSEGEQRMVYYVGWCVVQAVSRLANDDLLRYSYRSDQEAENGHAAFCSGLAHHYMGLAFYAEFINREIAPSAIKGAMTIIRNIRDVFQARIKDPKMRALLLDVPSLAADSDTSDALRLLKEAKKEALEETYKHFPDMTNYAMENAALATAAARQTEEDTRIRGYLGGAFPRVFYLRPGGFEMLPMAFELPLYNNQAPLGANYGALGSYIATAFVRLLFQALINADTDALMEFENKSSCFYESLEAGGNETLLKGTNLDLVQRAVAVRLLYSAYWPLDLRSVKMRLRGHPLITEKQLLFIFWCIFQCGKPNARDKCNVPLKAFRIFGVNFGCHRGSHMYTGRECPVLT